MSDNPFFDKRLADELCAPVYVPINPLLVLDPRIARHGPWGGLTRYGKPFPGKVAFVNTPAPLSKRARRRARGKARSW